MSTLRRTRPGARVLLALGALATIGLSACGDDLPDGVAVEVADQRISDADVRAVARQLAPADPASASARATSRLIQDRWILLDAGHDDLSVADRRAQARAARLRQGLVASASVGAADLKRFYVAHRSEYGPPRRRDSWYLRVHTIADASRARQRLALGHSWESTIARAKRWDRRSSGDALPFVEHQFKDKQFGRAMFAAKLEEIEGPLKTKRGVYLLQVFREYPWSKTPPPSLTGQLTPRARAWKVERRLHRKYASETRCAERYDLPECAR
jgi:hypothetical protein